jgi:peptidyl-prolyl cis-trans isomerase D
MIKFIHNNTRLIGVIFLFIAICFMISGVGLDILHDGPSNTRYAATVNNEKFTYADFEQAQRRITDRYRQMFGPNFSSLAQSLRLNIAQQAMDTLVDGAVLTQQAKAIGFGADDAAVNQYIRTEIFTPERAPNGFSPEAFRAMLQDMGMNYRQFSGQVKEDLTRTTLVNLLQHAAVTTPQDAKARFEQQETAYTVTSAEVSFSKLMSEVPTPSEDELQKFYETNATEYELPARVSYDYVVLTPKDFEKDVQVQPQDIEMFYTENSSKYTTPEQAKVRAIKILFPKETDAAKMAAVTEKANKAREEALSGVPFESLVTKYSDDISTKAVGGDRGWVSKGKGETKFDSAVFSTPKGNVTELIQLSYGYEIVKVEDRKESALQPLEDVRDSIAQQIKAIEAPAYAAAKAREIAQEARTNKKSLADIAKEQKLTIKSSAGLLEMGKDPETALEGVTDLALNLPQTDRLLPTAFDVGATAVVVQVKEFKEPATAPFEEVKARIVTSLKTTAARKLAEQRANELLTAVKAAGANFKKEADTRKATVSGPIEISRAKGDADQATGLTPAIRSAVFAAKSPAVLDRVFPTSGGYSVAAVTQIKKPEASAMKESLATYEEQAREESSRQALESAVGLLKASADLDIDESLLVNQ